MSYFADAGGDAYQFISAEQSEGCEQAVAAGGAAGAGAACGEQGDAGLVP